MQSSPIGTPSSTSSKTGIPSLLTSFTSLNSKEMAEEPESNGQRPSDQSKEGSKVDIHFDQSPSYRTYHVDGAHGGIAPQGTHLAFDFYVERQTHPKLVRHELNEDGSLGDEVSRGGRDGVVRESQCGVVMDWDAVLRLHNWLSQQIERAQQAGIIQQEETNDDES